MPIYEYKCGSCGETFEYMQRITEDPKTVCERCGGKLERLISQTSFTLKGGGWYKDLYSSAKPGTGTSSKAKESGDTGKGEAKQPASTDAGGGKTGSSSSSS